MSVIITRTAVDPRLVPGQLELNRFYRLHERVYVPTLFIYIFKL